MDKIIFIDTLTTGMNPDRCAIYRLGGIVTYDGVERERFEVRVRPHAGARIADQSLWISGESRNSLSRYQTEAEALTFFLGIIDRHVNMRNPRDKAYLAGFNAAPMDVPFLRELFIRNGNMRFRDYFHVQVIDLMTLATAALMKERGQMPDFHLETAARFLGVNCPYGPNYDCVTNAKVCLDMYRELNRRFGIGECPDTEPVEDLTQNFQEDDR